MASTSIYSSGDQGSTPESTTQSTGSERLPRQSGSADPSTSARHPLSADQAISPIVPAPPAAARSDELPLPLKDALFTHQIRQPRPLSITPSTIIEAGVGTGEKDAVNVHHALVKVGVLVDANEAHSFHHRLHIPHLNGKKTTGNEEFVPDTRKITSSLPNQLRVLSVPSVKFLVKVLFFWEEEVARWRAKEQDLNELVKVWNQYNEERKALDGSPGALGEEELEEMERVKKMGKEVEFHIQAVRLRQKVKPSERRDDDQLPRYQ